MMMTTTMMMTTMTTTTMTATTATTTTMMTMTAMMISDGTARQNPTCDRDQIPAGMCRCRMVSCDPNNAANCICLTGCCSSSFGRSA